MNLNDKDWLAIFYLLHVMSLLKMVNLTRIAQVTTVAGYIRRRYDAKQS